MLLSNLPPEAVIWREDSPFSVTDPAALLALLLERTELWGKATATHTGIAMPVKTPFQPGSLPDTLDLRSETEETVTAFDPFNPASFGEGR